MVVGVYGPLLLGVGGPLVMGVGGPLVVMMMGRCGLTNKDGLSAFIRSRTRTNRAKSTNTRAKNRNTYAKTSLILTTLSSIFGRGSSPASRST